MAKLQASARDDEKLAQCLAGSGRCPSVSAHAATPAADMHVSRRRSIGSLTCRKAYTRQRESLADLRLFSQRIRIIWVVCCDHSWIPSNLHACRCPSGRSSSIPGGCPGFSIATRYSLDLISSTSSHGQAHLDLSWSLSVEASQQDEAITSSSLAVSLVPSSLPKRID